MNQGCQKFEDLPVREIMQTKLITAMEDSNLCDLSRVMIENQIQSVPVLSKNGEFLGIVTQKDIIEKCVANNNEPSKMKASDCMSSFPYRVVSSMSCSNAIFLMSKYGVRELMVVKKEKLIGIVFASDISKVYNFCPNKKSPKHDCILIDIANEMSITSHYEPSLGVNIRKSYECAR